MADQANWPTWLTIRQKRLCVTELANNVTKQTFESYVTIVANNVADDVLDDVLNDMVESDLGADMMLMFG